jgi:hypothetical protein
LNPFAGKGYREVNGELVRSDLETIAKAFAETDFSITPSTDEQKLNRTERAYLSHLRMLYTEAGIQDVTLKLGDDCRYTPDFRTIDENGRFVFHEVKGFMRDDAQVKLKTAARKFLMFTFVLVRKNGAGWDITTVKP